MADGAVLEIVVIIVCLILAAFASAAETSLTGVRRSRVHQLADEGNRPARMLAALLSTPQRFLTTILVLSSVAIIVASSLATQLAVTFLPAQPTWLREVLAPLIMSLVVLVFSEITPKVLAIQNTERAALLLGPVVNGFSVILRPVIVVLTWLTSGIGHLAGSRKTTLDPRYTEEELRMLVEVGEQQGILEEEERDMIHGVFEFGDTLVREVMRPRIDVTAVPDNATFEDVMEIAIEAGHSRIPMYEENVDNIVGVLYVKDLLRYLLPNKKPESLRALARPPYFVVESQNVDDVFREMRTKKVHMAVVLDEYGGTAGIVTIEDMLEEIVGDIQDEYDVETPEIEHEGDNTYVVDGSVGMGTVNELLDVDVESDAYDTIAGMVYNQLGATPEVGETATVGPVQATVLEMDGRRVRRVRIERKESDAGGDSTESAEAS